MIDYVSGTLATKKHTGAVVDVQGIGYKLFVPTSTYEKLPALGQSVKLYTYQHVREDVLQLYGFSSRAEQTLFEVMLGASGVGPKLALAILSSMSPTEFRHRLLERDTDFLMLIPGVGRKTAERLIVELRDRVEALTLNETGIAALSSDSKARADALAALETLGFSRASAERKVRTVLRKHPDFHSADQIIRMALRK